MGDWLAAGQADAAAEEEFDGAAEGTPAADSKQARVLQEERPLLGEEETETVEIDLLVIGFDLCEVRVQGHVESQARSDAVLQIDTAVRFALTIPDAVVAG